jgi:predicted DsbA family dithiol-disulfide isomerase
MRVDVWSDVVCPWCYIGKRRFEQALSQFDHRDDVEIVWRSFELDPGAPAVREDDYATRLATKYGVSRDEAAGMIDRMVNAGAGDDLDFRFDVAQPGNTFDAHRLLHLAAGRGRQTVLKERFLRATFTEGEPIGDRAVLARLAVETGLDAEEVTDVLEHDGFADAVRADEQYANALGINAVPFFVIDSRYGVAGAQSPDVLLDVLEQAWTERPQVRVVAAGHGCEGDSCDV